MLEALFIAELCYTGAVLSVKVKLPVYIIGTTVCCWGIAVVCIFRCEEVEAQKSTDDSQFLITLLQCFPLRSFWDKSVPARCGVNDYLFFYGNSIPNIVTDFALLGLPLPCVWLSRSASSGSRFSSISTPSLQTLPGVFGRPNYGQQLS